GAATGRRRAWLTLPGGDASHALMGRFAAHRGRGAGDGWRPGPASEHGVARLRAVAPEAVVASRIARYVVARVGRFVAGVRRTGAPVVAVGGRACLTRPADARFRAVAEEPVVALSIRRARSSGHVDHHRDGHVIRALKSPHARCPELACELLVDLDE